MQDITSEPEDNISSRIIIIATTAVREATIVSAEKNIVNLSFKISNEEGIQAGIKYGIQLIKETKEGGFVADDVLAPDKLEKIYAGV